MMKYLFAGASSAIAQKSYTDLKKTDEIIALSTKPNHWGYEYFYQVSSYLSDSLPEIEEPFDGIVYFPGTINLKPFNRISHKEFLEDWMINFYGAVSVLQKYLPLLKKSENPSVVLFSTVAVQNGFPFHASISSAKGAIEGLTRSLAAEFAPHIRVNCIAPSLTDTPLAEKLLNTNEKKELLKNKNPLKRIGSPEDLANLVNFLLSDKSGWITGQVIAVDGGMNNLKV